MPRTVGVSIAVVAVLLLVSQLVLPAIAERKVEDRLEREGGDATAEVGAFPALRLLWGDGDSLEVRGNGLRVEPEPEENALERLDGFDEVDVLLEDAEAGPLRLDSFELTKEEGQPDYETSLAGATTGREVARYLGSRAAGPLGELLGDLAGGGVPAAGTDIPVDVEATVASRGGEVETRDVDGSVAGIPAAPLARIVVEAVAAQL